MFVKVKDIYDKEVLLNSDYIQAITRRVMADGTEEGCNVFICGVKELPMELHSSFEELEMLLDVVSTEKRIEQLKIENIRLAQRMQFEEIFSEIYGGKR